MYCFLDCETSGLLVANYPASHPNQARIIQVAALLLDESFNEVASFYSLIDIPEHVIINEGAFKAHGITKEQCKAYGMPIEAAIINIDAFSSKSKKQIGHNISFDLSMIHHEEIQIFGSPRLQLKEAVCTMSLMTPICKLPNKYPGKYKWPKLSEAYEFLFNKPFDKSHDALADVRACAKIYQWLVENKNPATVSPLNAS